MVSLRGSADLTQLTKQGSLIDNLESFMKIHATSRTSLSGRCARFLGATLTAFLLVAFVSGCGNKDEEISGITNPVEPTETFKVSAIAAVPRVISTNPTAGAIGVPINSIITATFSEAMNPSTITTSTFTLLRGTRRVAGVVTYTGATATFTPASNLVSNTVYKATVTKGVKNLAGRALATNFVWSFTTGVPPAGQAPVALGKAINFAVLAGSTVTNTGLSKVNRDLGVSPGTAVTGFPPGTVSGTIHAGDPAAALAKLDLTIAYNDAAGRKVAPISVAGNLGGLTLVPGLYKSTSSLAISSGELTLDARGDANAVFIFQIASTLTTTTVRKTILIGGAQAKNIFWQVGSSATLGTNSVFHGNIMADQSISLTTGATLNGRALARIGAVTLDTNIINP